MERDTDLRVVRTQQMIKAAFFELISAIGFEKITVQNLTKKAVINRSTFYLHYTDKFDLLNKLEKEVLDGLKTLLTTIDLATIIQFTYDGTPFLHILKILEYVKENEQFFLLMMGKNGDPSLISKISDLIRDVMIANIVNHNVLSKLKIPVNYLCSMLIAILTSFLNEWLRTGMQETPYDLANIVTFVMHDIPNKLIEQSM